MNDPVLIDRANEVIERLFELDAAVINGRAFRALLEDLHSRDLSTIPERQVLPIAMARAGILRAAIGTVMACLDPADTRRGNRASVGQILHMLEDRALVAIFYEPGQDPLPGREALERVQRQYGELAQGDLFERARQLRNDAVAHVLIRASPTPTVSYETIYELHDAAEGFVGDLYQVTYRGRPRFPDETTRLAENARTFWDTYFRGMQEHPRAPREEPQARSGLCSLFWPRRN